MASRPLPLALLSLLVAAPSAHAADPFNCKDGQDAAPRLQMVQNLWGLQKYPTAADEWPEEKKVAEIKAAGFDAFDVWVGNAREEDYVRWKSLGEKHGLEIGIELGMASLADAEAGIAAAKRLRSVFVDAHVGTYFTPEAEAQALLRGLVDRFQKAGACLVIQTHRGRVTQDLLRSVAYARAIPGLRFDLDLSHYLVAGSHAEALSPEAQAAFDALLGRAAMLDGRISNGEQVQVDMRNPAYLAHTERITAMWRRRMKEWLLAARRGDVFPFRLELGPPHYAILDRDGREIFDRWEQQKEMKAVVERLWNEAVQETGVGQRKAEAR
jgi:hypothetical protein